jgi:hypothetical protein
MCDAQYVHNHKASAEVFNVTDRQSYNLLTVMRGHPDLFVLNSVVVCFELNVRIFTQ